MTLTGDLAVLFIVGLGLTLWWVNATLTRIELWVEENS